MRGWIDRVLTRLSAGGSISRRLQTSFIILMALLLIPAVVSVSMMLHYSQTYRGVIRQVERVSSLKPVVQSQIAEEMWYVVAGHKTFDGGSQYDMINHVNTEIDALSRSAAPDNLQALIVARRTMGTLVNYIDRIGEQIRTEQPIAQSEALLEEVRSVSSLAADMLAEYADAEISAAAHVSNRLQHTLIIVLVLLMALLSVTLLFAILAQRSLERAIHMPIARLEKFAGALAGGNLTARAPETTVAELQDLTQSLNSMAGRLQGLIDENRREQENLKKSELRALQAQINPHFLYNTLDAIVWLAEAGQSREVIHITRALSDFFRISLSQGKDWIPLSEEIKHLTGYLTIQKIRYRDILDYKIDIPEDLYHVQVLKLLLQPLVENAIYHGVKHRRGRGLIQVTGSAENGSLVLRVQDNGAGMTPDRLAQVREGLRSDSGQSAGYGLFNVNKRIQLYYSLPQGLEIESDSMCGTTVTVRVPLLVQ